MGVFLRYEIVFCEHCESAEEHRVERVTGNENYTVLCQKCMNCGVETDIFQFDTKN